MEDEARAPRPCSLLLETSPPEREPLRFDVQLVGAPPEVEQLVNNIKQVAEDFLYHWKTFPIVLPQSRFSGPGNKPSDIIIPPPCDELDAAALDASMDQHPLSQKQLQCIREKGEFEVPSRHFPGQSQVWRVAGWLMRGRTRAREELYRDVARALALLCVVAIHPCREPADWKLKENLFRLLDLVFGMPSLEARDLEKRLREERSRYLVAELICHPENQDDIAALAAWVTRAMRRATNEKGDINIKHAPPVPYIYTTPQLTRVDLRLYRREILRRASGPLQAILERESRGWFLHFRERRAALLASQKVPLKDIEEDVRAAGMEQYVWRVCGVVRASEQLRALGASVPDLLADQLTATTLLNSAEEGVRKKIEAGLATAEARIRATHPILSRSESWRKEKLSLAARRLGEELRWASMEDAAAKLHAHKLTQHRYFLLRDLAFLRDREPLLMKELRAAKSPSRTFTWHRRAWFPRSWLVSRQLRGTRERVPVVMTSRATSIVTPRSDPSQPVFHLAKHHVRHTNTGWLGWRLLHFLYRTWCWSWNMMWLLGVMLPTCSPVSIPTLYSLKPLVADYELSQVNGTLFPKRNSEIPTIWSRLFKLWRHVSKERTRFETEPDSGLLGKGLSRLGNRVLNYGLIGGLGSIALLLIVPLVVVICSAVSLLAALTVPLWMPFVAAIVHVSNVLIYDFDCPNPAKYNRWFVLFEVLIWRLAIQSVLQPIAKLVMAVVVCPLAALVLLIGSVSWWSVRYVWEEAAWRLVLSRAARVPAHDSVFCSRVLTHTSQTKLLYQITAGQALAAVVGRGEWEALGAWAGECEARVQRPLHDYRHFVDACFGPFAVQIAKTGAYKQLEKECLSLTSSLREKVSARRRDLALGLSDSVRARVRMSPHDLRRTVQAAAVELSRLWGRDTSEEWWAARGLDKGDWQALAANTLVEVFDTDILVGLEESSVRLPLESSGEAARAWEERCGPDSAPPDVLAGPDLYTHGVWGEWIGASAARVRAPTLDVSAFNPRAAPHPPLPAPPAAALVLHNRDSENPVPLDSDLCAEILKILEDAPDVDEKREGVERYRGGGSEDANSDATSDTNEDASGHNTPRENAEPSFCRASAGAGAGAGAACRWTLTGRGVRLRADLASPEDVTLDADRHVGTSV